MPSAADFTEARRFRQSVRGTVVLAARLAAVGFLLFMAVALVATDRPRLPQAVVEAGAMTAGFLAFVIVGHLASGTTTVYREGLGEIDDLLRFRRVRWEEITAAELWGPTILPGAVALTCDGYRTRLKIVLRHRGETEFRSRIRRFAPPDNPLVLLLDRIENDDAYPLADRLPR